MSAPDGMGERFEVRDATGKTLGFFVPDGVVNALVAERDALRQRLAELQAEVERLRKEVEEVREERDEYLEAVNYLTSEDCTFNAREFAEMKRNGVPFEQVIAEVEQILNRKPSGG